MPGMKKKSGGYDRIWRPVTPGPEGPKKSMPRKKAAVVASGARKASKAVKANPRLKRVSGRPKF